MRKSTVQKLAQVAMLVALEVVLSRFLSINTFSIRIGFGFVPLAIAATLYGPVWAAAAAALADILGTLLFPLGPYFPGFTLTAALMGACFGLLLHKNSSFGKVVAAVAINRLPLSLGLNTLWISILYGKAFWAILPGRIVQELVLVPVQILVVWFITQKLPVLIRRRA